MEFKTIVSLHFQTVFIIKLPIQSRKLHR